MSQHTKDVRDYLVTCFEHDDDLDSFIYSAMADYSAGNTDDFYAKMTCATSYFFEAMETCTETNPDFTTAETFYADFGQQDDADQIR